MPYSTINDLTNQHQSLLDRTVDGKLKLHGELEEFKGITNKKFKNISAHAPASLTTNNLNHVGIAVPQATSSDNYATVLRQSRPQKNKKVRNFIKKLLYRGFVSGGARQTKTFVMDSVDIATEAIAKEPVSSSVTGGVNNAVSEIAFAGAAYKTVEDSVHFGKSLVKMHSYNKEAGLLANHTRNLEEKVRAYNEIHQEADDFFNSHLNNTSGVRRDINRADLNADLHALRTNMRLEREALINQRDYPADNPINQAQRQQLQTRIDNLREWRQTASQLQNNLVTASDDVNTATNPIQGRADELRGKYATYMAGHRKGKTSKAAHLALQAGATAGLGAKAVDGTPALINLASRGVAALAQNKNLALHLGQAGAAHAASTVLAPVVVLAKAKSAADNIHMGVRHHKFAKTAVRLRRRHENLATREEEAGHAQAAKDHRELSAIAEQIKTKQRAKGKFLSAGADLLVAGGAGFASYAAIAGASAIACATPVGLALVGIGGAIAGGYAIYKWARGRRLKKKIDQAQKVLEGLPANLNSGFVYIQGTNTVLDKLIKDSTGLDPGNDNVTIDDLKRLQKTAMKTLLRYDPEYASRRLLERLQAENDVNGATATFLKGDNGFEFKDHEIRGLIDAGTPKAKADAIALIADRLHLAT